MLPGVLNGGVEFLCIAFALSELLDCLVGKLGRFMDWTPREAFDLLVSAYYR